MVEGSTIGAWPRGVQDQFANLERTAERIAAQAPGGDLAGDLVELRVTQHAIEANLKVVKTFDETVGSLLDILA